MSENNKKEFDLDAEMANLDEILSEGDDAQNEAFPLDDDDLHEFVMDEPKKGKGGKIVTSVVLLALLGGVTYAGVTYLPSLMTSSELSDFEQNMMARSQNFSDTLAAPAPNDAMVPSAADSNLPQAFDEAGQNLDDMPPSDDDLSISNVEVTVIPEGEDLPADIQAIADDMNLAGNATPMAMGFDDASSSVDNTAIANDPAFALQNNTNVDQAVDATSPMPSEEVSLIDETVIDDAVASNDADTSVMTDDATESDDQLPAVVDDATDDTMVRNSNFSGVERVTASPMRRSAMNAMADQDAVSNVTITEDVDATIESTPEQAVTETVEETVTPLVEVTPTTPDVPVMTTNADIPASAMPDVPAVDMPVTNTVPDVPAMNAAAPDVSATTPAMDPMMAPRAPEAVADMPTPTDTPVMNPVMAEPTAPTAENVIVEAPAVAPAVVEPVPATPVVEDIEVVEAKPVETPKATPVQKAPEKKVEKKADPRVNEARQAMDAGDYQRALSLYDAVLASDIGNTAAMTGRQVAQAKLRTSGYVAQQDPSALTATILDKTVTSNRGALPTKQTSSYSPTQTTASSPLDTAIQAAKANPRDAKLAVTLAQAYQQEGQNAKALEWYRKALQLDAIYSANINRMAVYDAMATLK